jgi:hypothetical protein
MSQSTRMNRRQMFAALLSPAVASVVQDRAPVKTVVLELDWKELARQVAENIPATVARKGPR